jgi:hypothetical protein
MADAVSNVLLFVPFGISIAALGVRVWTAVLCGVGLSLVIECAQAAGFPLGRSPSFLDIVTNGIGVLIGLAMFRCRKVAFDPSPELATLISAVLSVLASLCIWSTGVALARAPTTRTPAPVLHLSRYAYSPGFGWYAGSVESATVNGAYFQHQGTGPVVVEALGNLDSLNVALEIVGRDSMSYPRSAFFLHTAGDTTPIAVIVQNGENAEVRIRRPATGWGLRMPTVRLRGAFRVASGINRRRLLARSTPDSLILEATAGTWRGQTAIALTPLLGWAIIQSVVESSDPTAWAVQLLWVIFLTVPIGWFAAHGREPLLTFVLLATVVLSAIALTATRFELASLSGSEWGIVITALSGAFTVSSAQRRARSALAEYILDAPN